MTAPNGPSTNGAGDFIGIMYTNSMSYIDNLEFLKNNENEWIASIYPLNKFMEEDGKGRERLGGSIDISEQTGGSRFEGLGVPVGLYLSKKHSVNLVTLGKSKEEGTIEEEQFNRLFENIVQRPSKKTSLKRRKASNKNTKKV